MRIRHVFQCFRGWLATHRFLASLNLLTRPCRVQNRVVDQVRLAACGSNLNQSTDVAAAQSLWQRQIA
nr:hypothetical protein Hi04_10k_c5016_00027 [uncultured bacterium]